MVLAWARTIHKFQGLQAGPTCSTLKIIADPGTDRFEAGTPGLLYTLISRAVTIGKLEGGSTGFSVVLLWEQHVGKENYFTVKKNRRDKNKSCAEKRLMGSIFDA